MMKRIVILCLSALMLGACSSDTGSDDNNGSSCTGGKCDAIAPQPLNAISGDFGACTTVPDLDAVDDFFALEVLNCRFVDFDESVPASIDRAFVHAELADGQFTSSTEFVGEDLDGGEKDAAGWRFDDYPVNVEVQPIARLSFADTGRLGDPFLDDRLVSFKVQFAIESRPSETVENVVGLPLEFWPVVVWPTEEFAENWNAGEIDFFAVDFDGEILLGESRPRRVDHGRFAVAGADLKLLPNKTFTLPVQKEHATPTLTIRLESDEATTTVDVDGPGYFLLEADGSLTKATPQDIEERGMVRRQEAGPGLADAGTDATSDAGTDAGSTDGGVDGGTDASIPDEDPCDDACSDTEVCVDAACVTRSDQIQSSCSSEPTAACDGEDTDCADDHVCVEGLCRKLQCQTQNTFCDTPPGVCDGEDTDCPEDHVCADGQCLRLNCQVQNSFCDDPPGVCDGEDTDCPDDHVCTEGKCVRLSCKAQDTFCDAPEGVCDGENSDCPADHVCADDLCRRLTCQGQDQFCDDPPGVCDDDNADCPDEHVCVEGKCRRLTCQIQDSFCDAPKGVCDPGEDADCPDGHVCQDGECLRLSCL